MRIAIDAMGGDQAPGGIVAGAVVAARHLQCGLLLVGARDAIERELARHSADGADIEILDAPDVIDMEESAAAALRRKPSASIRVAADACANEGMRAALSRTAEDELDQETLERALEEAAEAEERTQRAQGRWRG